VLCPRIGRIGGAGSCPTIRARIVSSARVQRDGIPAPDDHFSARPDCRVVCPRIGRIGGAGLVLLLEPSSVAVNLAVTKIARFAGWNGEEFEMHETDDEDSCQ